MNSRYRQLLACALLLVAAAGLLMFLNYAKFASTFENRTRDRHGILVDNMADALEAQLALGLTLGDTPALRDLLDRGRVHDSSISAIAVLDVRNAPSVVVGVGRNPLWQLALRALAKPGKPGYARQGEHAAVAMPLRNAFNVAAGWLVLEYDLGDTTQQTNRAFGALWPAGLFSLGCALLLLVMLGPRLIRRASVSLKERDPKLADDAVCDNRWLTLFVFGLLLLVQCVFAWNTYQAFDRITSENAPVLAATLAQTVRPGLQRALDHDIPLNQLRGVEDWLRAALSAGPEFNALSIRDMTGQTLFHATANNSIQDDMSKRVEFGFPVQKQGVNVGSLQVSLDLQALAERTRQLAIEFATLLLIGVILTLEILKSINSTPRLAIQIETAQLRLPLFLFFLSSELPRSFLPIWSNDLARQLLPSVLQGGALESWLQPLAALPETVLAAVPISAYLLSMAVSSSFAGRFCARHGPRNLLLLSTALGFVAHSLALGADSLLPLCLARVIAGLSFGSASVAAFDFIGRQPGGRAAGVAVYLTALVAAGICGTGLGALIVDRAGIPFVFMFGLGCSTLAALAVNRMPTVPRQDYQEPSVMGSIGRLMSKPSFLRMIVLVTLPMQIVQQGLLFYWAPLALAMLGELTSFVGLAMMGYFLMVLMLNGPSARLADRTGSHSRMVAVGLTLAGVAGVVGGLMHNPLAIGVAIVLIGLAWAMGFPSQGALALRLSQSELGGMQPAVAIGVYRTIERTGAMLAPIVVALLIVSFGFAKSATIMGIILFLCALAHGWISERTPS